MNSAALIILVTVLILGIKWTIESWLAHDAQVMAGKQERAERIWMAAAQEQSLSNSLIKENDSLRDEIDRLHKKDLDRQDKERKAEIRKLEQLQKRQEAYSNKPQADVDLLDLLN